MKKVIYGGREYEVPDWTRWMATDEDGEVWASDMRPTPVVGHFGCGVWVFLGVGERRAISERVYPNEYDSKRWEDSLVELEGGDNHENR